METDTAVGSSMKATVDRDALAAGLQLVSRAAASRGTVQVLGGVGIRAANGLLELEATDMELSLRTSVTATVDGEGALVVPAKLLGDIVRLLPAGTVTLAHKPEDGVATVESGAYASRINVFAVEDFPRLPAVDVPLQEVDASALLDTIQRVSRAASRDESRPVLTGILAQFEGTKLTMAATDSYRMSVKETQLESGGVELEAIIPARALDEVTRIAAGAETVQLGVNENHVIFGAGNAWLTTRRIDGQFPNVAQLRPESFEVELELDRAELLEAVRRAAVMAQRNTPLRLRFAEGELTISAQSQDVGETRESLAVRYTGEPLEIGFNAEFLREGLESVTADEVKLELINPLRPGLISADGDSFWYLIMPIRLAG
ncbi:DNA polymerase III subunit beta [Gaiella sp.]|uniref:DNA polymerase III subunit beta n=1 Tax=Gaiella sp. TaxID=2663207 RepID=UPI002E2F8B63|nr:DNA polymerase III subunit beta [Gaiella sp.]